MKIHIETEFKNKLVQVDFEDDNTTPENEKGLSIVIGLCHAMAKMLVDNLQHNPDFNLEEAFENIKHCIQGAMTSYEQSTTTMQ